MKSSLTKTTQSNIFQQESYPKSRNINNGIQDSKCNVAQEQYTSSKMPTGAGGSVIQSIPKKSPSYLPTMGHWWGQIWLTLHVA
ncbi:hypothetical protein UPYG_G00273740 [Umbra pygmaea]|uniref:Uncharacterized protein n=1 Tax=Umbra pygmaea TaxID=75934 RepID=A0ABD0WC64_UMBPY